MDTVDQIEIEPQHRDKIRVLTLVIVFIIALIISLYTLVFTPWGNRQIAPIVQNQLESVLGQPVTLTTFKLTLSHFELALSDKTNNHARIEGSYLLLPPYIDARYDGNLSTSEGINIARFPMEFKGSIKGSYYHLALHGTAHLFSGDMTYDSMLLMMKPNTLALTVHDLHYQDLMDALEYPHESDTIVNGNVNIKGIVRRDINATGEIIASTHRFKASKIMEDDNESVDFWSLIADKNGKIAPFKINANIKAQVDELGILEQFVSYPLRTSATLHAKIEGSQHHLTLNADATAAKGKLTTALTLHKLQPQELRLEAKALDAASLFSLLSLPQPFTGQLEGSVLSDFKNSTVKITATKAQSNPEVLKQHYHITQPLIHFNSNVTIHLTPNSTHTSGRFVSDLEDLHFDGSPTHEQMLQELLNQIKSNRPKGNL